MRIDILRRLMAVLVGAWMITRAIPALADEITKPTSAEARAKLSAGAGLFRAGEFEKALEEYKAGVVIEDAPIFHYNLGQSYRHLGRYKEAIWHFQRFLRHANPLPDKYKQATETMIRDMKSEMDRKAMTNPPTEPADGEPAKNVPAPPQSAPPASQASTPTELPPPWYNDALGWGLAGSGVLGAGVSVALLVNAKSLDDDANAESSQVKQDELRERASSRRLAGAIVGVVSTGLLVTGIVKLVIAPNGREQQSLASAIDISITPSGFAIAGRF